MAGQHHFCGKIMTVSQHCGRKRPEQLLQSSAIGTKRLFLEQGLSLQQNQLGLGKKKRASRRADQSFAGLSLTFCPEGILFFFLSHEGCWRCDTHCGASVVKVLTGLG